MASSAILDLTELLQPISDDQPTGEDLRLDASPLSSYQTIKTARYAARDAEKNNLYSESGGGEADEYWRKILTLAPKILREESKDLEVATWLTEAMVRRYGFQGLRDALQLIEGLLSQFWEHLYPMPDEDGIETRVAPLAGLNGTSNEGVLIAPIRRVPLTEGYTPGPFAYYQYQQAVDVERTTNDDAREAKAEKLGFSLTNIEQAVAESSESFFVDLLEDVTAAVNACRAIETLLDNLCGSEDAPSTRAIIVTLEECRSAVNHIAKHKLPIVVDTSSQEEAAASDTPGSATKAVAGNTANVVANALVSRDAAFKQLLEIAQFFRKTEPHSPVSYALEKAVKWGNMSLEDLIVELIPDSSSRKHFSELTGVKSNED
ncbi:MAG: type VI secretion protein [Cellvibrio sp. 79]|nr:MAG: type VI secretion protein [Cellvibrio sp. 79]